MFNFVRFDRCTVALLGLGALVSLHPLSLAGQGRERGASAEPARTEVAFGYSFMRANAGPANCGCFNLNGGTSEIAARVWRNFSAVSSVVGEHTSHTSLATQPLSLILAVAGPRFTYPLGRYHPFAQGLVGVAHGFDAPFPTSSSSGATSATRLGVLVGGGLDIGLTRRFAVRAFAVDYGLTHLPNSLNDQQSLLRVSGGVVLRIR